MSTKKSTVDSPTNNFSDLTSETRGYEAVTVKSTRFTRYKHTPIHENMASNYRKLPTNNGLNETNLYSNRCGVNNLNFVLFKFSRRNSLRNATLIFLILLIGKGNAKAARNKIPLIQTDASQEPGYITSQDEVRLRETISNSVSMDDIDFQSANYIDHWGDDVTDVLLVAGRNHVYMINNTLPMDEPNIKFIEILTWISSEDLIRDCQMMGKKPEECQNFIRVVERKDNQTLFVCGTNAYTPTCRTYLRSNFNSANENSISETEQKCRGKECPVPYNPKTQSVTLYTNTASGKQLFSALLHDFYGTEPVILKRKLSTATASITTEPKWLYKPTFIKMVEYGEKVYLFFREIAQESETRNGEEMVYSRVAQICKDDLGGGEEVLYQKWTTFLKARISCNNSNSPNSLQFNNLTAVSDIKYVTIDGQSKAVVFATFTTPWDWQDVSVSSVCMYSLQDDIQQVFDTASFLKEYKLTTSTDDLTLRYLETTKKESRAIDSPDTGPRPGQCSNGYQTPSLHFIDKHPLMFGVIYPTFNRPIFITQTDNRVMKIAVDAEAGLSDKVMLYLGTEEGKLIKVRTRLQNINGAKAQAIEKVKLHDYECYGDGCCIRELRVARSNEGPSALIAFSSYMSRLPLANCNLKSEECCSLLPDCGWNKREDTCVQRTSINNSSLIPSLSDDDIWPTECSVATPTADEPMEKCKCSRRNQSPCKKHRTNKPATTTTLRSVISPDILAQIEEEENHRSYREDFKEVFHQRIMEQVEQQFKETINSLRDEKQREALKQQLEDVMVSTANLVLTNHRQEYCLPTPTVNHLTHVYPLLLREIELWHQTAVKKMTTNSFPKRCWSQSKFDQPCTMKVTFSVPLINVLWEPLAKLITDFMGECGSMRTKISTYESPAATETMATSTGCKPLLGLQSCKDASSSLPHCQPKSCTFPKYAIDVRAFFKHANDSRQFLEDGDDVEPLWKPVNITLSETESIHGHLEVHVQNQPFTIDYSPVAEKVKISFRYAAIRDCSLSEPGCAGSGTRCNPTVEQTVGQWYNWIMSNMTLKMRNCDREMKKDRRTERERTQRAIPRELKRDRSEWLLLSHKQRAASELKATPNKCKRITGRIRAPPLNVWKNVVTKAQRAGGVYTQTVDVNTIEFYSHSAIVKFFKNMCSFEEPNIRRANMNKMVMRKRNKFSLVQVMASSNAPMTIKRDNRTKRVMLTFYSHKPK